jgi:hypothetical protein
MLPTVTPPKQAPDALAARKLRAAERSYQRAAARAEELREARNQAIRDALAAGLTHRQVADATGLTHGRVGQLAMAAARKEGSS